MIRYLKKKTANVKEWINMHLHTNFWDALLMIDLNHQRAEIPKQRRHD